MDVGRTTRSGAKTGVVAGSVWESRMKSDEVKGGIKVFNGESVSDQSVGGGDDGGGGVTGVSPVNTRGKIVQSVRRKTWRSESFDGVNKNPILIGKEKSETQKNSDELSVPVDGGIKRSPIQLRKVRSESRRGNDVTANGDGVEKSPVRVNKAKPESSPIGGKSGKSFDPVDKLMNVKSDTIESSDNAMSSVKSETTKFFVVKCDDGNKGTPIEVTETRSEEICREFGVCQEKELIKTSLKNVGQIIKSTPKMLENDDEFEEMEDDKFEEMEDDEFEIDTEKKKYDIKEINIPEQKHSKVMIEEKKIHQFHQKTVPNSPIVKKQSTIYQNVNRPNSRLTKTTPNLPASNPIKNSYDFQRIPRSQSRLQNLVDLIMWRDVSRSTFVFGIGTFVIISSSYTRDLNISFISVVSYFGLVYLALIFLYTTINSRGLINVDESREDYVVGEEEAIWILKLLLPYINEFLLSLRALFSGDPATTMKLAAVLFVLARCGSSITVWKMVKLGFFGVFIFPKVCSSYSTQLTLHGKFWIQRMRDAWDSCSHKKAVSMVMFTLVWNLSSVIARIWALFMLFVAVRCYQQSLVGDDPLDDETTCLDTSSSTIDGMEKSVDTLVE